MMRGDGGQLVARRSSIAYQRFSLRIYPESCSENHSLYKDFAGLVDGMQVNIRLTKAQGYETKRDPLDRPLTGAVRLPLSLAWWHFCWKEVSAITARRENLFPLWPKFYTP